MFFISFLTFYKKNAIINITTIVVIYSKGGIPLAMEFRRLSEDEQIIVKSALELTGSTCTGSSYSKSTKTYYLAIEPQQQITDRLRAGLQAALRTTNVVLNGVV